MNKIILLVLSIVMVSCNNKEEKTAVPVDDTATKISGQELFEGKGTCTACHLPDQKVIGPSISEIAKIYKEKNASIVAFLKEESEPIVEPAQYETMKTNFAVTKKMTDQELQALEDYIYTFLK